MHTPRASRLTLVLAHCPSPIAPQAVFDANTGRVVLGYSVGEAESCDPGSASFVIDDGGSDGVSWGPARNISGYLGRWAGLLTGG